jgi:uncharacterized protein (DUF433 family)/transposase-like protein
VYHEGAAVFIGGDEASMARKKVERTEEDIRDYPSYSIEEVAEYIDVPKQTLRAWVSGYSYTTKTGTHRRPPIIRIANRRKNLMSFFNLIEAQVLAATRKRKISLYRVRKSIEYMRENLQQDRPLLTCVFDTVGQNMFVQQVEGVKFKDPLNITRHGQFGFKGILRKHLNRIERDSAGLPTRLYPMKATGKTIAIHPCISSGKPSLRKSGVMAEVIASRKREGETVTSLARDFKTTVGEIKAAVTYFAA